MAGACAVCRQPFSKADKFVLVGSEAVHPVCVASLQRSVVNRLKKQLVEMGGAFDASQVEIQRLRQHAADSARECDRLRRDLEHVKADHHRVQQQLRDSEANNITLARERDTARRERDAARAEAALHQVLSGAREVTEGKKDDRDATVVRFSLLELDDT